MKLPPKLKKKLMIITAIICMVISVSVSFGKQHNITILEALDDIITYPIEKLITVAKNKISGIIKSFKDIENLNLTNKKLQQENEELLYNNIRLMQLEKENILLKDLLDIKNRYKSYPSFGANVIGKDAGNWYKVFTIDKGETQGVSESDIVLANGALVGIVNEVNLLSSIILSIIDDRSTISVEVMRSGDTGILSGQIELSNKGLANLEVDINSDIVVGDQIITSHISDKFPPGILIGEVIEVIEINNGLVKNALVLPFVDFSTLKYVLLIERNEAIN
ncbi:rod shape-determining protein MreC [Candidatus Epulonipiscioides gigas]|nr:rod shape-determining protein MreC [Epulopiscium sp. SCG-C07WGA-EpuloA2]